MTDVGFFRLFNLLIGIIGIAVSIGLLLAPKVVSDIEKKLDRTYSTEKLEKLLNQRKNLSEALLKRPKIFGGILLIVSFLLLFSSILFF